MDEPPVTIINFFVYQNSVIERKHWAYLTPADDNATICMLPEFESSVREGVKRIYFEAARNYMTSRDKWYRIKKNGESSMKDAALAEIDNGLEQMGLQVWVMWTGQSTLLMLLAQREMESRGERDFPESMMQLITETYAATGPEGIKDIALWMTEFQKLYTKAKNSKAGNTKVKNAELESELWRYLCKDIDQPTEIWGNWRLQLNNIYFANRLMLPLDDTISQTKKRIERLESKLFSEYRGGNLTSLEGQLLVSSVSNAQVDLMDLIFRRRLLQRRTATEFPGNGFPVLNETSLTRYLEEDIEKRKQSPDPNSDRLRKNWLRSLIRLKDYNSICRGYLWHTLSFTSGMAAETFVICQYFEQNLLWATIVPPWMDSTLVENTRRFLQCLKRYVREAEVANREIKAPGFVYQWPPSTIVDDMAPTPADYEEVSKMSDCRSEVDVEAEKSDEIQSVGMAIGEYSLAEVPDKIQTTPATPDPVPNVTPSSEQDSPELACKSFSRNPVAAVVSFATDFMVSAGMGLCWLETDTEVAEAKPSTEISILGRLAKHPESETVGRIDENLQLPFMQSTSRCSRGKKKELMEQETLTCLTMVGVSGGKQQQQRSKHLAPDIDGRGDQHQAISKNLAPSKESSRTVDTKQLHPQRNHRKKAKAVKRQPFQFALKSKDELASFPPQKGSIAKQSPSLSGIDTSEKRPEARKPPAKQSTGLLLDRPMPHNKSGAAKVDKALQTMTKDKRASAPKKTKRSKTSSSSKSIPPTNAAMIENPNPRDGIPTEKGPKHPTRAHRNRSKALKEPKSRPVTILPPVALPEAKQETIEVCRDIKPQNALNSRRTVSTVASTKGSTPPRDPHAALGGAGTKVDGQAVQKMELPTVSKPERAIDNPKNGPPKKEQASVCPQRPASLANLKPTEGENLEIVARHLVDTEIKEKSLEKSIIEEVWQPVSQKIQPDDFHDLKNFPALTGCGLDTADKRQAQSSESWKQWTRSAATNFKPVGVNVKTTQDLTATVNTSGEGNSRNESQSIPTYHEQSKKTDPFADAQNHGRRQIQGAEIATSQETEPECETIKPGQEVGSESNDYTNQGGSIFEENYQKANGVLEILKDSSAQSHDLGLEPLPAPKRSGQLQAGFTEDTNIIDTLSIRSFANLSNPLEHLISKPANLRKWDVPDPPEIPKPRQGPLLSLPLQQYSWPPQAVRYLELLSPKISTKSHARKEHYIPITQPLVAEVPKDWKASKLPESPSTISVARKLQELSPGAEHGAHEILPVGYGRNQRFWHEQPADISQSAYLGPINDQIPPIDPFWKQLPSRPSHYLWFIHRSKAEASQVARNTLASETPDGSSNCSSFSSSDFSLDSGNQSQHGLEPIPEAKAVLLKETKAFESAIFRWSKQVGTSRIIERYRPEVLPPSRPPSVTGEIMLQTEDYSRGDLLVGPHMLAENWPIENTTGSMPAAISPPLSSSNNSYNRKMGGLADPATPNPLYPIDGMSTIDDNTP